MNTQSSVLVKLLSSMAFLGFLSGAAASDEGAADSSASSRHGPPLEVIPVEIYDPHGLVARGPHGKLVILAKGFSFTEGPAVDRRGNVFFTDQPNDKIFRWDAGTGQVTLFLEGTGRANGMHFDRDGNLIAAADLHVHQAGLKPE